jgi:superfamily I DNA/RNA helicase
VVSFIGSVGKGFSASAFGDRFESAVSEGCTKKCKGKSATIQALARYIVDDPTQRGVGRMLRRLLELRATDPTFADIEIDGHREFWDAVKLADFETPGAGLAEITHRRTYLRPKPPERAISTIHKAKGLECESVIVMPCDAKTFPDRPDARCLLYVAISRARSRLLLVVSRDNPSPLLVI